MQKSSAQSNLLQVLESSITEITPSQSLSLSSLPSWALLEVARCYRKGVEEWYKFVVSTLEEYCKDVLYSKIQWNIFVKAPHMVFTQPLTYEQMLWVAVNSKFDREDLKNLISNVRESILPWLNPQLWKEVDKRNRTKRENVDYEEQRKKMILEDEHLDVIQ